MALNSWNFAPLLVLLLTLGGSPVLADEFEEARAIPVPAPETPWDVIEDRILKGMRALDEIAPFEDKAPLWDHMDAEFQKQVIG